MSKYVVLNPNGTFVGVLCHSYDEARELVLQKSGRVMGKVIPEMTCVTEHIHCPVNGYDCPYWQDGICLCEKPIDNCDDFASVWGDSEDYVCDGGSDCVAWGE